jgi:ribosomal protein S18 acetylase RimI-like enzyme
MISIRTLYQTNIETIVKAFNLAFSDYIVPMKLAQEQLEAKIRNENIKLEYSIGAFEENQLIAFILHGSVMNNGKQTLYNSGTGVVPDKRGNNLTLKLYEFLLPQLPAIGTNSIILEVITTNKPAITTYKKTGFKIFRELDCYKGTISKFSKSTYQIKVLNTVNWNQLKAFWDWEPTWQNYNNAVENGKNDTVKIGAFANDTLIGYLILNKKNNRIQQFAVDKSYRCRGVGVQLFNFINDNYSNEISIINVPCTAYSSKKFLVTLGLQKTISQYEMILNLS